MMEDFFTGSGTKIRPSNKDLAQMRQEYEQAWQVVLDAPLQESAQRALDKLSSIDQLLQNADLDGVRQVLASPELLSMGIRITPKPKNPVRGGWTTCIDQPKCKESLDDARKFLQELEEWCFSNRVEYYNTADQAQIMKRGDGVDKAMARIKASIDEPLELTEQGRDAIKQILASSKGS